MKSAMQAKNSCPANHSGRPVWSVKLRGLRRRDTFRPAAVLSRFQAGSAASTQAGPQAAERADVTSARPQDVVVEVGEVPRVPNALVAARSLFAALNSRDVSAVLTLLEEDVWYENLGCSTPLRGRAAVGRFYLEALADLPDDAVFVLEGPAGPGGGDPWDTEMEGPSGPVLQAGVAWHLEVNGVVVPLSRGMGVYWAHPRSGRLVRIWDNPEHTVKQSAPALSNAAWASPLLRGLGPLVMPAAQGVTSFLNTRLTPGGSGDLAPGAPSAADGGTNPGGATASAVGLAAGMLSSLSGMLPFQPSAPASETGGDRNGAATAGGGGGRALYRDHTRLSAQATTTTSGSSITRNSSSGSGNDSSGSSRNGVSAAAGKAVGGISAAALIPAGNGGGALMGTTVGGGATAPATRGAPITTTTTTTTAAAAAVTTLTSSAVVKSLSGARTPLSTSPSAGSSLAAGSNGNGNDNGHANGNGHLDGSGPGAAAGITAASRSALTTPSSVVDRTSSATITSSGTGSRSTTTAASASAATATAATTVTVTTTAATGTASASPRASPAPSRPSPSPAAVAAAPSAASAAPPANAPAPAAAASSPPAAPAVAVVAAATITRAGTSAAASGLPASNGSSTIAAGSSSVSSRSSSRAADAVLRRSLPDAGTSAPPSSSAAPSASSEASEAWMTPAASSFASMDDDVPGADGSAAPGSGTAPARAAPAAVKAAEAAAPVKVSVSDTTNSFVSLEGVEEEEEPGAGRGALPFSPSTSFPANLSGLWEKDAAASQTQEYESMLDVLELGGLQKVTARLIDGLDVRQDEERFEVGFVTVVPFFRVTEKSRFGEPTTMMRRDLRSGRQTALACRIPGGVKVDMSWEAPLAGSLREEYVTSADGHMMAVTSTIRVGQRAATATQVYRRSSRNKSEFLASQRSSYGSLEDVLKSQEEKYGKTKH